MVLLFLIITYTLMSVNIIIIFYVLIITASQILPHHEKECNASALLTIVDMVSRRVEV